MTRAEIDLYCGLLKYAYGLQVEKTGLVWGSAAEALRDKMYEAISSIDPLMGLEWGD